MVHFYDYLEKMIAEGALTLTNGAKAYTYHDPCRLGRMAKVYESPRSILKSFWAANSKRWNETGKMRSAAVRPVGQTVRVCSKQIQVERLKEAEATGAQTLVTACPKCQIHLSCALANLDIKLEIKDLTTLITESIHAFPRRSSRQIAPFLKGGWGNF